MEVTLVESAADAEREVAALCAAPEVALDVEGDGLFRYRAQLCTVQVSDAERIVLFDTLAFDPVLLAPLLGADGPVKVIHDASFDARLLYERGVRLERLYDTSIAARFSGEQATGLASLSQKHLEVTLSKEQQHADWGKRPLDDEALAYLADDVRHLLELKQIIHEQVVAADLVEEVQCECEYLLSRAYQDAPESRPPWTRVKGALDLPGRQRAILRELCLYRETLAQQWNVPPYKVMGNDALLLVAQRAPKTQDELFRVPRFGRGRIRKQTAHILRAVKQGAAQPDVPADEMPSKGPLPSRAERDHKKRLHKLLSSWRKDEATRREIDAQAVLPGHCLQDLVAAEVQSVDDLQDIPGFGEVRRRKYGDALVTLLQGQRLVGEGA